MDRLRQLLKELENVSHDKRMNRMVLLGRASASDPQSEALIEALSRSGFYERMLALQTCYGSRDGARVLRAITDPSRTLQGRARALVTLCCSDSQIEEALLASVTKHRQALLAQLRNRRRFGPIDRFIDELCKREPYSAASLIPFASIDIMRKHFEIGRQTGGWTFWQRLARFHPELASEYLCNLLEASEESADPRLRYEASITLGILGKCHPQLALPLAETLMRKGGVPAACIEMVAQYRPNDVADLLLRFDYPYALNLNPVAAKVDQKKLALLLHKYPQAFSRPVHWFRQLSPEQRGPVFEMGQTLWRDHELMIDPQIVRRLPASWRHTEARRHLDLPALATRPIVRLNYAANLPWEEVRDHAKPFFNHPEPELRSAALLALIGAARFERARLSEMLGVVKSRKNEQDPVRCAMLAGLRALPPGSWKTEHLSDLGQIIRDALSAADLSTASETHAQSLAVSLLPFHPTWSVEWLVTLVKERGRLQLGQLEKCLTDDDVRRIAPLIEPVLKSWNTRERETHILAFATSLGRRIQAFPALQKILEHIVHKAAYQWNAAAALNVLYQNHRSEMARLIPEIIEADRSWITQYLVSRYLHRRRQDLLTPFLGRKAYSGRFSTGNVRYVLPFADGFFRWTPEQQTTFAKTLNELTHYQDSMRDVPTILCAVRQMAALPSLDTQRLSELARDTRPPVQEIALRVLGNLDSGQGIPLLIDALGDERSRVAIYALRRALLVMPEAQALKLLRSVSLEKVTVAKETIRLMGEMSSLDAFRELQRFDGMELHRDVRVALLRALWSHLSHAEAWDIMHRSVDSPDPALMTSVIRIPVERLDDLGQERLAALLGRVMQHLSPSVRTEAFARCISLPLIDSKQVLLPLVLNAMSSIYPDERKQASFALFAIARERDAEFIGQEFNKLMPNRRGTVDAVQALRALLPTQRKRLEPTSRRLIAAMKSDPLTSHLALLLAAIVFSTEEFIEFIENMAENSDVSLHADTIPIAIACISAWAHRPDREELSVIEGRLTQSSDARLRRLALAALTAQSKLPGGWTEARLERLQAFRQDKANMVASTAQFTLPEEEVQSLAAASS